MNSLQRLLARSAHSLARGLRVLACAIAPLAAPHAQAAGESSDTQQTAQRIREAETALRGKTSMGVMKMTIKRSDYERTYDLLVMSDDRSDEGKVLIRMLGPALWRGNATLKVGDRISFYDPRTRRTTVMGNSMLGDNWMGSHFTNDDLMRETDLSRHYSYEVQAQEKTKDALGQPVQRWRIQLLPKAGAPVAWGRVLYQLDVGEQPHSRALPVQVDYFRRPDDTAPVRSLRYSQLTQTEAGRLPMRMTMLALDKPGEYTQIDYSRLRFDKDFSADEFSDRAFR